LGTKESNEEDNNGKETAKQKSRSKQIFAIQKMPQRYRYICGLGVAAAKETDSSRAKETEREWERKRQPVAEQQETAICGHRWERESTKV